MPNQEKVLRKVHSAPKAIVLPTRQAFIIPTKWKRVSVSNTPKTLSPTPECYAVKVHGKAHPYSTAQSCLVETQRLYRAHHPTCAVGLAVLNFLKENNCASISNIEILKGI